MALTIQVDIVSAQQAIFSGAAEMVFAPAVMGEVGIAPRHSPMLTFLKAGDVRVRLPDGAEESFYVSGGILEVQPHIVTILSDVGVRARDLDEAKAIEAKERAERILSTTKAEMEYAKAEAELAQAVAQLRAIQRLRKKGR
jgi:F-type H+-transporting ATPase subunit epsilon